MWLLVWSVSMVIGVVATLDVAIRRVVVMGRVHEDTGLRVNV